MNKTAHLSPRLVWMEKHGLVTEFDPGWAYEHDDPWMCYRHADGWPPPAHKRGFGHTEEEACADYAEKVSISAWDADDES